jgi:PHP family Zn ribbon phosphoesterase
MEILQEAEVFEKTKMSNMSNSDRITASREAKRLVLAINLYEYKRSNLNGFNEAVNKQKKKSIDIRLKGIPNLGKY